ncbi:MAG: hypothetical protein V1836_02395 [Candidatus Aenigmatarchaeota archaeon]
MALLLEKNKLELIESINGIREDLGQQPYDMEYLSKLGMEDLQKMVDNLSNEKQGKLELDINQRERIRFDFYKNVTFGFLFIVIMLMVIFTVSGLLL